MVYALFFDRIYGMKVSMEMRNFLLWCRVSLWWWFSVLYGACRYACFVGIEGIVSRIALTRMMRQWTRSSVIIVGNLGIRLLSAPNLFKKVSYLLGYFIPFQVNHALDYVFTLHCLYTEFSSS